MRLILGSQSPRRREILSFFAIPFEQISPHFAEELVPFEGNPIEYAKTLAYEKAASLAPRFEEAVILTADTVVYKDGKQYGKPANEEEAFQILSELNGSWHQVFTALTLFKKGHFFTDYEETKVLFHSLTPEQIRLYHQAFHSFDKAGGYGVQMGGHVIVKRMEGCFYNVMGLPTTALQRVFYQAGIDLWHHLK